MLRPPPSQSSVDLPPGFSLAKVRILETDPAPSYWLSLNVYRVSGITTGLRAEWSTYVDDGQRRTPLHDHPCSCVGGVDRSHRTARPPRAVHPHRRRRQSDPHRDEPDRDPELTPVLTAGQPLQLHDHAARSRRSQFRACRPANGSTANDYIYWRNGVNDRIFHNSTSHSAPLISVDLADVTLDDDTEWAPFVDRSPAHVLVYLDKIQFMIGPWWNVTEPDGRVDPATRAALLDLKKTMYGGLSSISALSVLAGNRRTDHPVLGGGRAPVGLLALADSRCQLGGVRGRRRTCHRASTLTTVRLQDDDADAAHWLSLNVRRVVRRRLGSARRMVDLRR